MKKKIIIITSVVVLLFIVGGVFLFLNREYPDDEDTLYTINFGKTKLRFERYDYSLGQNQIVGVEKTTNKGRTYEKLTDEPIIVSMEPKFIFINEKLGFAISKSNLTKSNHFMGVKVTQDGGKTFVDGKINYDNPNIDILTIEDVPYQENGVLKLVCSIYQIKSDQSGYEDVKLIFTSSDNGLTWDFINKIDDISLRVKNETITSKGATFIMKNISENEYEYGADWYIEYKDNDHWKELETITGDPLVWTAIAYVIKPNEEKELNIDWSYGYGELKKGTYRFMKKVSKSENKPIDSSKMIKLYGEFEVQ